MTNFQAPNSYQSPPARIKGSVGTGDSVIHIKTPIPPGIHLDGRSFVILVTDNPDPSLATTAEIMLVTSVGGTGNLDWTVGTNRAYGYGNPGSAQTHADNDYVFLIMTEETTANIPPAAHAATHQNGGSDEVATATAGANAIPKAGSGGKLDKAWVPDFVVAGGSHASGGVPDPGSTTHTPAYVLTEGGWAAPSGGSLASLTDAVITSPADGDMLTYETSSSKWKNKALAILKSLVTTKGDIIAATGSAAPVRVGVGSNGQVLTADSGASAGVSWQTPSGGGGGGANIAHSYLGYNTVGGSQENITTHRVYAKKVTLATDGFLASVGAYLTLASDDAQSMTVGVYNDNAGTPQTLLAYNGQTQDFDFLLEDSATPTYLATWIHKPLGIWLTAGDYWIAVQFYRTGGTLNLAYDGSGSDRYYTADSHDIAHWGRFTPTTSSNKYSIRADFIAQASVGPVLLDTKTPTGTNADFTSISSGYKSVELRWWVKGTDAASQVFSAQFNGDTGSNYDRKRRFEVDNNLSLASDDIIATTNIDCGVATKTSLSYQAQGSMRINGYADTNFYKSLQADCCYVEAASSHNLTEFHSSGWWRSTAAINEIKITLTAGNFASGSVFELWGYP